MENITNRTILTTMIIIGVVIALMIVPLYNNRAISGVSYTYDNSYASNLGATAYNANYSGTPTNSLITLGRRYPYVPVIQTSYPTGYQYQYQAVPVTPTYKTYTYYTTTTTPSTTSYDSSYNTYGGYVPAGCEGGTDYSTTTNEPCG